MANLLSHEHIERWLAGGFVVATAATDGGITIFKEMAELKTILGISSKEIAEAEKIAESTAKLAAEAKAAKEASAVKSYTSGFNKGNIEMVSEKYLEKKSIDSHSIKKDFLCNKAKISHWDI